MAILYKQLIKWFRESEAVLQLAGAIDMLGVVC